MNAKQAKLLRKRIKEVFNVPRITGSYSTISNDKGRIRGVLDPKSPRGLYQRTKRIIKGTFHAKRAFTRQLSPDGRVIRTSGEQQPGVEFSLPVK